MPSPKISEIRSGGNPRVYIYQDQLAEYKWKGEKIMRPSRAKMPATRAAGGFHPGASLKLVITDQFFFWLYGKWEQYTFIPGAGGLLGGRNIGTPARGVARTPAKTPARPQPTPSRRAQDGVVSRSERFSFTFYYCRWGTQLKCSAEWDRTTAKSPVCRFIETLIPVLCFCWIFPFAGLWLFQNRNFLLAGVWWHFAQACSTWGFERLQQQGDPVLFQTWEPFLT